MKKLLFRLLLAFRNSFAAFVTWLVRPILHQMLNDINRINQQNISTALMHQKTFGPFKNVNRGKDVVVVGCGPSVNDYVPVAGAVHIGVNAAHRNKKIAFDYLFQQDKGPGREMMDSLNAYAPDGKCVKFYGIYNEPSWGCMHSTESDVIAGGGLRYRTDSIDWCGPSETHFSLDIATCPLADYGTVVFSALQFALWTNPKRILLVGCDCTPSGHFYQAGEKTGLSLGRIFYGYRQFKLFAEHFYPGTEIISVNPVGLKGYFRDWYQKDGPLD